MNKDELTDLLESVRAETVAADCHINAGEYSSAKLCVGDACFLLAGLIFELDTLLWLERTQ